jgi:putative Holliday junction resolvase
MSGTRRIVGVDYGAKRVGLAKSDPLLMFAQPVGTYSPEDAVQVIRDIAAADGIEAIVIGWPLDSDGNENASTERVEEYIAVLKDAAPGPAIERWDERGSSRAATEELVRAGSRRKHRARGGATDRVAAALILQEYLDERNAGDSGAFQKAN